MGALSLILSGCEKGEPSRPKSSGEGVPRQLDAAYQKTLSADRIRFAELLRERNAITEKMKAMIAAKKSELKTEDLDKVKSVLDQDAAWQALYRECEKANERLERQRQVALKDVREQMTKEAAARKAGSAASESVQTVPAAKPVKKILK